MAWPVQTICLQNSLISDCRGTKICLGECFSAISGGVSVDCPCPLWITPAEFRIFASLRRIVHAAVVLKTAIFKRSLDIRLRLKPNIAA